MGGTGGSTSTTWCTSYDRGEVEARLVAEGFVVEVADGYRTPTSHPSLLPGWYVVRATKPIT